MLMSVRDEGFQAFQPELRINYSTLFQKERVPPAHPAVAAGPTGWALHPPESLSILAQQGVFQGDVTMGHLSSYGRPGWDFGKI